MSGRHIIAIVSVVAVLAVVAFVLRSSGSGESPAASAPAPAAELPPAEPAPAPVPEPAAPEPVVSAPVRSAMEIPVLAGREVKWLRLTVAPHPEPGRVVHVVADPGRKPQDVRMFEDLATVATFIALEAVERQPAGIRVRFEPGDAWPHESILGALVLGIRLGLENKPYPRNQLVVSAVGPAGELVLMGPEHRLAPVAQKAGLELVTAPTVDRLLADWNVIPRPERSGTARLGDPPRDLRRPAPRVVAARLREVLAEVMAKKPAKVPLPPNWDRTVSQAEARVLSFRPQTPEDLVTVSVAGAEVRAASRAVRFATGRIEQFTRRIVEEGKELDGWSKYWLTLLVETRVRGEQAVRMWSGVLGGGERGRQPMRPPAQWLRERTDALKAAHEAFARLLRRRARAVGTKPRPYPFDDPRQLAWPPRGVQPTRSAVVDWGEHTSRLALVWSQYVIAISLGPKPDLSVADAGALALPRKEEQLERMVSLAERLLRKQLGKRRALGEVHRLLGSVKGERTVGERVRALERLWYAAQLDRDALGLARALRGTRGRRGARQRR